METTINSTDISKRSELVLEDKTILIKDRDMPFSAPEIVDFRESDQNLDNALDLRSDQNKFLVSSNVGVYNFFYSVLPSIFRLNKNNPGSRFILEPNQVIMNDGNKHFLDMFSKVLAYSGIDHEIKDLRTITSVIANRFCLVAPGSVRFTSEDVSEVSAVCRAVSNVKEDLVPNKMAYISRKMVPDDRSFVELSKPGLGIDRDVRIYNEHLLEEFLSERGFDIVSPESFESMEDQIRYFSQVHTIVSATSSGIANAMFMKPGGTVVEFPTTFLMMQMEHGYPPYDSYESLHHLYAALSYVLGHNYVAIPNNTRQAEDIRDKIVSAKHFKELFNIGD